MAHKVLIVGSDEPGRLESSYVRAFKDLGCNVHLWNPIHALNRVARGQRLGRIFSAFVHVEAWARKANLEFLHIASSVDADLILVIGTTGLRAGTLAQLRVLKKGCVIYCVYPDSPHYLDAERINCFPFFDRVMASSPAWVEAFARLGARRANFLPFGADTHLHHPANGQAQTVSVSHDVAFIGNWRPERETFLDQLTDFDLSLWGSDYWKNRTRPGSLLRSRWSGRPVIGPEFSQVCSQSRILLNIMDPITWPGPNMRSFEQPACRAFSLVTRTAAVLELFTEGENIECFESAEEASDKIRFYLQNEQARRSIADRAYEFVVHGGHTYADRARQLLAWVAEDSQV